VPSQRPRSVVDRLAISTLLQCSFSDLYDILSLLFIDLQDDTVLSMFSTHRRLIVPLARRRFVFYSQHT